MCTVNARLVSTLLVEIVIKISFMKLFDKSRNIQLISKAKLMTQRLATKLVVKYITASGGHGSQLSQCACSSQTAQNLDIQTQDSVQIVSVGKDCKHKFFLLLS